MIHIFETTVLLPGQVHHDHDSTNVFFSFDIHFFFLVLGLLRKIGKTAVATTFKFHTKRWG